MHYCLIDEPHVMQTESNSFHNNRTDSGLVWRAWPEQEEAEVSECLFLEQKWDKS